MRFEAEVIPEKKYKPIFLFKRRYCDKCMLGFQFEEVPSGRDDRFPTCPICGRTLYLSIYGLRTKKRIK